MLMELASVIEKLGDMLPHLRQYEGQVAMPSRAGQPPPQPAPLGSLLEHWQKLFPGQKEKSAEPPPPPRSDTGLAAEFEQLLERLRHAALLFGRKQQVDGQKLQQATRELEQSPFRSAHTDNLLAELVRLDGDDHQPHIWALLEYYHAALRQLVEQERRCQSHHHELCAKLQQLIDELHFSGEIGDELGKIQQKLLQQVSISALPPLCLRLIELTIEGCRQERQNSATFLLKLNENLGEMHHNVAISLSEGQALLDARTHHGHHIAGELRAIGEHLVSQSNARLKEEIELRMRSITHIMAQHERLQEREQSLLNRMNAMEQQINELKNETAQYRQRLSAQNEKLFIDNLTQIYNRAAMEERLEVEYRRWLRHQDPLCIALLDIDHFKEINDNYGHLAGDKALRLIARIIQKSLRESDFVARFGGEEFVILLPGVNPDKLEKPLEKLREQIKNIPFRFKDERVTITASIGATLLRKGDCTTSAMERADQALYQAKRAGRNQIVVA
ncbi:GGDEF domain-containing protein [Zobellella endophytica]|uniref:diguanylate cyclase n=1 Tax=Zobellella endophytica TaxID=2116700 RepID=A0A2P7R9A1_9GAMM|nr:GGDEF domain-containing protein [Zobellella endophytica]PSJ46770.1 GGDEF domain-containing protein [Zobellella endophytica]